MQSPWVEMGASCNHPREEACMLRILPMTDGQAAGALLTASLGGLGRGGVAEEVAGTLSVAVSV